MNIVVRNAAPGDGPVIADFNSRMAVETEGHALDPALIGPGVAALLDDAKKGRYWVAVQDGQVIGQIMVTYEWSDWRNGMLWWIQSVYIAQEKRQQGVFSTLYRHVESLARSEKDVCGLRLYVENKNKRAQETYVALGMIRPGYQVMEIDFTKDQEREDA